MVSPTGLSEPALRLMVGPLTPPSERLMLGVPVMPLADRLMLGLVRLIEGEAVRPGVMPRVLGSEPPVPGVLVMLGPVRPVGDGVSRLAASDRPGWRVLGRLGPRSRVEADGERLIEGEPVVPVRGESGRVTPADGVRETDDGVRGEADGARLMVPDESRWIEGELGADGRFTDGLEERPLGEPLRSESTVPGLDGEREIEGARSGALNRELLGVDDRLTCPSGLEIEGEPVDRLGASRKASRPLRSKDRLGVETLGRWVVEGRSTVRGAGVNDGALLPDDRDGVENDGVWEPRLLDDGGLTIDGVDRWDGENDGVEDRGALKLGIDDRLDRGALKLGADDRLDRGALKLGADDRLDRGALKLGADDRLDRGALKLGADDRLDRGALKLGADDRLDRGALKLGELDREPPNDGRLNEDPPNDRPPDERMEDPPEERETDALRAQVEAGAAMAISAVANPRVRRNKRFDSIISIPPLVRGA